MIVAALIEFAVVLILMYHPGKIKSQKENKAVEGKLRKGNVSVYRVGDDTTRKKEAWVENYGPKRSVHEVIDHACFRIFPIVYALFNIIYLATYVLIEA